MEYVNQGENLLPLLFALFVTDLQSSTESLRGISVELKDYITECVLL